LVECVRGTIEESLDLTEPYRTVTDRYYTPYYKVDADRERKNDLCLLVHSNRISLVALAPSHALISRNISISAVNCEVSKKLDRKKNCAVGKSKKGGQNLDSESILCYLESEDASYGIEAIAPGKLVCMNSAVLSNPNLIREKPDAEGHIAILLPYLGHIEECKSKLMKKEDYEDFLKKENGES